MAKVKKLKQATIDANELVQLQGLLGKAREITSAIGQLELQKQQLLGVYSQAEAAMQDLKSKLEYKYGTGKLINSETGEIKDKDEDGGLIRKISIGTDYKVNAMHYSVGQEVYGGHVIVDIKEEDTQYNVYIKRDDEIKLWKSFNKNMGISIEYNINFD